ncbi:MAG TPA: PGPGW domain-containing protein [Gaiellaceae bacterium]|nr:PGPGW domain-containing protein [Gaiellaceae bacterium]
MSERETVYAPAAKAGPRLADRLVERRIRHRRRGVLYRVIVAIAGVAVLLAGLAMLVLPGPGLLVTGAGLTMLALEFAWAERLLSRVLERLHAARVRATRRRNAPRA